MQIKIIPNVLEKENRKTFEHIFSGETIGKLFDKYVEDGKRKDYLCIVSGKKRRWSYVPNFDDEVIFVNNIKGTLVVGGLLVLGGVLASGTLATVLISVGVGLVLSYGMSKLFSPSVPDVPSSSSGSFENSKTYSWDGIKNMVGEGNVVPVVYGTHRVGGALIEAYIDGESSGGKQDRKYLNALFAVSEGEIHGVVEGSIKLNRQDISYYSGVSTWYRPGTNWQSPIDSFSNIVRHYGFSPEKPITSGLTNAQIYQTHSPAHKVKVVIKCPALYSINTGNGNLKLQSVRINISTSPVQDTPAWTLATSILLSDKTKSAVEYDAIINAPDSSERFLIRVERITEDFDTDPNKSGSTYLKAVSEIKRAQLSYPGTALYGLRIKATDRLSGVMPDFTADVIGRKVVDVRDLTTTIEGASNPANIVYDLLTNTNYGLGRYLNDDNIDITSLQELADWCDEVIPYREWDRASQSFVTKSQKRYSINLVIDTKFKAVDLIEKILMSVRAIPYWEGNRFKVVIERPSSEYAQLFTMGNIVKGSFESSYASLEQIASQVEIKYLDEDNNYKQTPVLAIDKSRLDEYPEVVQSNLYGITRQATVKREAIFQMKKAKALLRSITFAASIDAIVCQVGDLILFQHDTAQWGYGGRTLTPLVDAFVLDRKVPMEAGKTYTLRVRNLDGSYYVTAYSALTTETTNIIPVTPPAGHVAGEIWTFGIMGLEAKPFRVMGISKKSARHYQISCQEYNESIFDEDEDIDVEVLNYSHLGLTETYELDGNIEDPPAGDPTYVFDPSDPTKEIPPLITDVTVGEQLEFIAGAYRSDIVVTFAPTVMSEGSLSRIVKYEIIYSTDGGNTWRTDGETSGNGYYRMIGVNAGDTYHVLVKPHTSHDTTNYIELSAGALNNEVVVQGKISAPLAPSGLTVTGEVFQNTVEWVNPTEPLDRVEVWCATENLRSSAVMVGAVKGSKFTHGGLTHEATYYYWIRAYDPAGNSSAWFPAADDNGVSGSPSTDATKILSMLTGQIEEGQLATALMEKINDGEGAASQVELLSNQWTLKIQEDEYVAGAGLALYEDWDAATTYSAGDYVWASNSQVYKAIAENVNREPGVHAEWALFWEVVLYGAKSEFIVLADKFAVVMPDGSGEVKTPFVVGSVDGISTVGIDGTLVVDGTISANKIQTESLTTGVFTPDAQNIVLNSNQGWSEVVNDDGNRPEDGADVTDYTDARVANAIQQDGALTISRPGGATYNGMNSNEIGAIKITLPQSWSRTMLRFAVHVYNYAFNTSFTLVVGGYLYSATNSFWENTFAQLAGHKDSDNAVRFGHDGTYACVIIGEIDSSWDYVKVVVKDFQAGHINYEVNQWDNGWNISLITALPANISKVYSNSLLDANAVRTLVGSDLEPMEAGATNDIGWRSPNDASQVNMAAIDGRTALQVLEGGVARFGNDNVIIDTAGNHGSIIVAPDGGPSGQDYMLLSDSDISFNYWTGSSYTGHNALKRIETGYSSNGSNVVIPGHWKEPPHVIVSPRTLSSYHKDYSTQNQAFNLDCGAITETSPGSMQYQFTPSAQLIISGEEFWYVSGLWKMVETYDQNIVTANETNLPTGTRKLTATVQARAYSKICASNGISYWCQVKQQVGVQAYYGGSWHTFMSDTMTSSYSWNSYTVTIEAEADIQYFRGYRVYVSGGNVPINFYDMADEGCSPSGIIEAKTDLATVNYCCQLANTTELANGTINWIAIGQ